MNERSAHNMLKEGLNFAIHVRRNVRFVAKNYANQKSDNLIDAIESLDEAILAMIAEIEKIDPSISNQYKVK